MTPPGLIEELQRCLPVDALVSGDAVERVISYWNSDRLITPLLARPATTAGVSDLLRVCNDAGQRVVTIGGATNCVHAADPDGGEVVLSTERLDQIEQIDTVQMTATVGAGVRLEALQDACRAKGLMFPLDLGARGSCTIGGNIATNAGGINVLRFGMMRALVLGLEVVLADGTVLSSMNQMLKNNSGYDLKQLFIGSEGTLGVVTRAVVRLFPAQPDQVTALVALRDFDALTTCLDRCRRELVGSLNAFEVMWGDYYRAVTEPGGHRAPIGRDHDYYAIIETQSAQGDEDARVIGELLDALQGQGCVTDAVLALSGPQRDAIWQVREDFDAILSPAPCFLYDVSLPIPVMDDYIRDVSRQLDDHDGLRIYVLGHIADGNLHFFVRPGAAGESARTAVDRAVYEGLLPYKGALSAEHGIGAEKLEWLGVSRSETEIKLMKQLKRALDPEGILNRGRVVSWSDDARAAGTG